MYGDIGTSPLYVFNNIFVELHTPSEIPSRDDVLGATSLVIWTIVLIVLVKYALIVMLADDNGEGKVSKSVFAPEIYIPLIILPKSRVCQFNLLFLRTLQENLGL